MAPEKPTLLTIAPELRNQIYEYALPVETQEFRFSFGIYEPVPGILQVSRQTRSEALEMYYRNIDFDFVVHHKAVRRQLAAWASTLSKEARTSLRENTGVNLHIVFDHYHPEFDTFRHCLHVYAFRFDRWLVVGLKYEDERKPLAEMAISGYMREWGGCVRPSDLRRATEPGVEEQREVLRDAMVSTRLDHSEEELLKGKGALERAFTAGRNGFVDLLKA